MPDFSTFSERSVKVTGLAMEESRRLGHNYISSEQLLVGMLGVSGTKDLLNNAGITLEDAKNAIERIVGRGSGFVAIEIPYTSNAVKAIEKAIDIAHLNNNVIVDPEHLLLALLEIRDGYVLRVLEDCSVSIDALIASVKLESELLVSISSLPAVPTTSKTNSFGLLNIVVLPQEHGGYVAEVSTMGSWMNGGVRFKSVGYGDSDMKAIAASLEKLAAMYQNHQN